MMSEGSEPEVAGEPRINVWRLGRNLLLTLVFPCAVAIVVDQLVGTWPIITLLVAALCFPIAGIVVMRSALQELQKVIEELAPAGTDSGTDEVGADTHV